MTTTRTRQRFALALISAATVIGSSSCGTTGTATNPSSAPPAATASPTASMPGMSTSPAESPTASTGSVPELTIHIKSFAYTGPDSVPAGATVTVMNMDAQAHTLTADDGSFDAVVKPGTSATFSAPGKPGSYTYHCTYHSNMRGTLTVK
ncbi:plastocyanin [Arthrobacter sp. UYCu512]|uniref:cupredoxin domain-containing protein n=1 Tax=Arthrobacter sp. UYCu512 TaxID=3156338 RepID=UPI00339110EF